MIATGSDDCIARVFKLSADYKTCEKLFELAAHSEPINNIDISPDKKLLITSSTDKTCTIFNLQKGGQKL